MVKRSEGGNGTASIASHAPAMPAMESARREWFTRPASRMGRPRSPIRIRPVVSAVDDVLEPPVEAP